MYKVGITGGIGSGKSLVAGIFNIFGIPVYASDQRAKDLMASDPAVRRQLIDQFGEEVFIGNELQRSHLANIVFADKGRLEALNAIVHPAVGRDFESWIDRHDDVPYVLKEAALIFEAGIDKHLDAVITIWAPEDVRIARVTKRDKVTSADVKARMENQWTDQQKIPLSDFVIINDGSKGLIRQVTEIHNLLLKSSGAKTAEN